MVRVERIIDDGFPVRYSAFAVQEFSAERHSITQFPGGFGKTLPALGFLDQVIEGGILEAAAFSALPSNITHLRKIRTI